MLNYTLFGANLTKKGVIENRWGGKAGGFKYN